VAVKGVLSAVPCVGVMDRQVLELMATHCGWLLNST
jgi:hypothetical protein